MSEVLALAGFPSLAPTGPAPAATGGAVAPADALRFAALLGAAVQRSAGTPGAMRQDGSSLPAAPAAPELVVPIGIAASNAGDRALRTDAALTAVAGAGSQPAPMDPPARLAAAANSGEHAASEHAASEADVADHAGRTASGTAAGIARTAADASAAVNTATAAQNGSAIANPDRADAARSARVGTELGNTRGAASAIAAGTARSAPAPGVAAAVVETALASPAGATALAGGRARVDAPARTADVTRPASRSLDALAPEFRARLERVLGRLEGEHGYQVEVLETYRTPERQQHLFEQGRTRPGPVVTWTRASQHTQRLAADLHITSADGPAAYEKLAVIAAEEGLRTLGARDPGHVELATPRAASAAATAGFAAPSAVPASAATSDPARRVLSIARANGRGVPSAADVKQFAGELMREAVSAARGAAAAERAAAQAAQPASRPASGTSRVPGGGADVRAAVRPELEPAGDARSSEAAAPPIEIDAPVLRPQPAEPIAGVARSAEAPGIDAAQLRERVERVIALQESLAAQPAHSVLLRLDEGDDALAQIRVGLRGGVVDTRLDVRDAGLAALLRADMPELQRALERRGLEADPLRVFAPELVDAPAPAARTGSESGGRYTGEPNAAHRHAGQQRQDGQPQRRNDERQREEEAA